MPGINVNTMDSLGEGLFEILKSQAAYSRALLDVMYFFFDKIFYFFLVIAFSVSLIYVVISMRAFFYRGRVSNAQEFIASKAPRVTIQIPTKNEVIAIRCAKKCLSFDYPRGRYDILIGDDSDNPAVSAKIARFAAGHRNVRVISRKEKTGFKPGNLNNMLAKTKGDIIVIFDSDFIPEKDFLKRIVTPFMHDDDVSAVQARWDFVNANQNLNTVLASSIQYVFHHTFLPLMQKEGIGSLCGSAEAVRKNDLIALGGWASGSLTEDIEYSLRLHNMGKKIVYLPDLVCYNELPSTLRDLYRQQMRWAYGIVESYKSNYRSLLSSKRISARQKLVTFSSAFGYVIPVLIAELTLFGVLSFLTHPVGPIDVQRFLLETTRNVVLTFGLVIACAFSLYKAKKLDMAGRMLISSFTVGLVVTFYVNKGILKALLNKPMHWYLLKKTTSI